MTERDKHIMDLYHKSIEENETYKKAREHEALDKTNKREILLLADKKIRFEDLHELFTFLMAFTPFRRVERLKYDCVQKTILDDYLVKIWLDTNGLFHAEDVSETDNWYEEAYLRKFKRLTDAFGYAEDADVRNY